MSCWSHTLFLFLSITLTLLLSATASSSIINTPLSHPSGTRIFREGAPFPNTIPARFDGAKVGSLRLRGGGKPTLLVVGSVNADIIVPVDQFPKKGETVLARDQQDAGKCFTGGKGANQAVAISRLGAMSRFMCQFGNDGFATIMEKELKDNGVDISKCGRVDKVSGQGIVLLEQDGAVSAIVVHGANSEWPVGGKYEDALKGASAVLLQREVPEHVNIEVAKAAVAMKIPVFQDVGGENRPITDEILKLIDYLCPNETELARLTGMPTSTPEQVLAAATSLQKRGAKNVLVTLGAAGSLLLTPNGVMKQECCPLPPPGKVVDETGAGDSFRAAFALGIAEGRPIQDCLQFASAAGAVAVSRMGAVPSLPSRDECDALCTAFYGSNTALRGGGGDAALQFPLEFGSRLNSMKDRLDLWGGRNDVWGWVERQGCVEGLGLVDFNYPQHLEGKKLQDAKEALSKNGLKAGAICMRFPKEMQAGAFTHPDEAMRKKAIQMTIEGGKWAEALGAKELVIWSAYCGYDYHFQADYKVMWARVVEAFRQVCDACKGLKVSLEFKPTDENTRFFAVPSTGAAMLLVGEVNRENFGLTLDFGHLLMCGENPAQSVAMVGDKLFGVQLNDGYGRGEDGLMFGSVHTHMALEMVYWLQKVNFKGHVYFDTFPRNEDPVRECEYNIRRFKQLWKKAERLRQKGMDSVMGRQDALAALEMVTETLE